jgi:hypothetical protein
LLGTRSRSSPDNICAASANFSRPLAVGGFAMQSASLSVEGSSIRVLPPDLLGQTDALAAAAQAFSAAGSELHAAAASSLLALQRLSSHTEAAKRVAVGARLLADRARDGGAARRAARTARVAAACAGARRLEDELASLLRLEDAQLAHIDSLSTSSATVGV